MDLLKALCAHPAVLPFALAGGTSLALRFGHRLSVDLDFFTSEPFENEPLVAVLKRDFAFDERRRGPTGITGFMAGVKAYQEKFPQTDCLMMLRSLGYFEDAEKDEEPESLTATTWAEVKQFISAAVRGML